MINKEWHKQFKDRLAIHYDELKWLYIELYNDYDAFDDLCSLMYEEFNKRDVSLKKWDKEKTANSNWYKGNNLLGDLMYVSSFGKTLKGVKSHLDYLKETGINYLHLMPLLDMPKGKNDGGYAVSDFRKVKAELGDMEDLRDLAKECQSNGIDICLDFVMNHTSDEHEWAKKAKSGDKKYQDYYFFYDNWDIPNEYEKTVPQVFPQTAPGNFTYNEESGKVVMTTFYPYQWDLNYGNPIVFNEMTANMLNLCNHGVGIIRLDAVPYIWKKLGTNCRNLPEVHTLVRMMRMISEIVCPGTLLLGEVVMEPKEVVPYFGTTAKPECHMLYNVTTMASTWHTVACEDVSLLAHQLQTVFSLPKDFVFLNYLRCHDDIGWGLDYQYLKQFAIDEVSHKKFLNDYLTGNFYSSKARGELYNDDQRLKDARLVGMTASLVGLEKAELENNQDLIDDAVRFDLTLHAFLLTQTGIPVLYSGDEIGQKNDYSYHNDKLKDDDSRYLHRGNFDWEEAKKRDDLSSPVGKIYQGIKTLRTLRKQYDCFDSKADTWLINTNSRHILGIGRYLNGQKILAFFNFSKYDELIYLDEQEEYKDLIRGNSYKIDRLYIKAHDFHWLLKEYGE